MLNETMDRKTMEPCARGQLLILAPWEHHNEKLTIRQGQCLELNDMAKAICKEPLYFKKNLSRKTGKNLFFSPFLRNFATKPASIMDVAFILDKYFKGN